MNTEIITVHSPHRPVRSAIATLELVLALPLILSLVVGLVWLGYSVIGQTRVLSQVRHDAFSTRFEKLDDQPFNFKRTNIVSSDASEDVSVTPVLRSEAGAKAKLATESGNWDHRSVEFSSSPNLEIATELMIAAQLNGLISQFEDLRSAIAELQRIGDDGLSQVLLDIATELSQPSDVLEASESGTERRAELERDLHRTNVERHLRELKTERKRLKELMDKQSDSGEEGSNDELYRLQELSLKRIEIEIALAELKLEQFD